MDKKPLIGVSILAVVLLMITSLNNVVGYQSVKSTANDSPLFQMRTQRATNLQQNTMTTQYLGSGDGNQLQFPPRNNTLESTINAIIIINQMDERTFTRFTEYCIQRIRTNTSRGEVNPIMILPSLYFLRAKPQIIIDYILNTRNEDLTSGPVRSICYNWFPGCTAGAILTFILQTIVVLFSIIYFKFISYCSDTYAPCGVVSKMHYILEE